MHVYFPSHDLFAESKRNVVDRNIFSLFSFGELIWTVIVCAEHMYDTINHGAFSNY